VNGERRNIRQAESAASLVREGNRHYATSRYDRAQAVYEQALALDADCLEARYNRACAAYQQEQYDQAIEEYKAVAAQSEEPELAVRAKYNLGNSYFQRGRATAEQNPQAALKDMERAVEAWRQVQQMRPEHPHVDRNIEVGRLWMRELRERIDRQQQQNRKDGDQDQQSQQQQSPGDEQDKQSSQATPPDPNAMQDSSAQVADPNAMPPEQQQDQSAQNPEDQNQAEPNTIQSSPQDTQEPQQTDSSGRTDDKDKENDDQATAERMDGRQIEPPDDVQRRAIEAKVNEILEQERKAKKARVLLMRRHHAVEKDW